MNICFSLSNLELGGAQMFVTRLARELASEGKNQVFIYDHWPETCQIKIPRNSGVRVKSYNKFVLGRWIIWKLNALFQKLGWKEAYRKELNKKRFLKFLSKYKIEILNSHSLGSDLIISECELPDHCTYLPTLHGEYELLLSHLTEDQKRKVSTLLTTCSKVIYTAEKNLIPFHALASGFAAVERINVGIDRDMLPREPLTRDMLGLGNDDFIVGMVSRGIPEKNWEIAIRAVLNARQQGENIKLILIGTGDYLQKLVALYNDKAILLVNPGKGDLYYRYYSLFELMIFPSLFPGESMPNAVIEAISWNVPVVATRHAELPYMLEEDSTIPCGRCISPSNELVRDFSRAIVELKNDRRQLKELSENCSNAFRKFDLKSISKNYMQIFKQVLV